MRKKYFCLSNPILVYLLCHDYWFVASMSKITYLGQCTYRIGGYRTPLLIRTPGDKFWTHNGHIWQLFVQYYCIFGQKIMKNGHCEQPEIAKNE